MSTEPGAVPISAAIEKWEQRIASLRNWLRNACPALDVVDVCEDLHDALTARDELLAAQESMADEEEPQ